MDLVHAHQPVALDPRALFGRDDCIQCSDETPVCNCTAGEQCQLTVRLCNQCPTIQCISSNSSSRGSINPGVIAGPVVAVLAIASLALFWWLRRKKKRVLAKLEDLNEYTKKAESAGFPLSQPGTPQMGLAGLGRQSQHGDSSRSPLPQAPINAEFHDENGATIRVYNGNTGVIDLRAPSEKSDPFSDQHSTSSKATSAQSTNIIPIQYVPPNKSDETRSVSRPVSQAARTLNEARENLFRGGPPQRPVRSPDLDLRLNQAGHDLRSPGTIRDSYLSGTSGAPSFLSGTTDLHVDAPKIVTSKKVHIGRFQQAEMVNLGASSKLSRDTLEVNDGSRSPGSATFGKLSLGPGTDRNDDEATPANYADLRFSLGSLAYRDSVSTTGTARYLARPDSAAVPGPRSTSQQPRESSFSSRSYADSVLSAFPMIAPGQPGGGPPLPTSLVAQDNIPSVPRPPPSYKPLISMTQNVSTARPGTSNSAQSRPTTAASDADSFFGSFPFVPPNATGLPSAALPSAAVPETAKKGRNTMGISAISEGLGGFDFNFDVPPLPDGRR